MCHNKGHYLNKNLLSSIEMQTLVFFLPQAPTDSIRAVEFRVTGVVVVSLGGDVGLLEKNEVEVFVTGTGSSLLADINIVCNVYGV